MKSKTNISIVDNAKIRRKSDIIIGKKGEFPSGDILDANATKELVDNVAESVQAITDMAPEDFDTLKEAADAVNDLQEQIEAAKNCINVTYSEIVALRDTDKLIPGQFYRITDYVTTVSVGITNARSAGHQFDILVRADSGNTLNEQAWAVRHEGDTYFKDARLEAWEMKYRLDNVDFSQRKGTVARTRFGLTITSLGTVDINGTAYVQWNRPSTSNSDGYTRIISLTKEVGAELDLYNHVTGEINVNYPDTITSIVADITEDGKGTITWMKDEHGNECPYDFKNIQYKRYMTTDSVSGRTGLDGKYMIAAISSCPQYLSMEDVEDFIWAYTFSSNSAGGEQTDYSLTAQRQVHDNVMKSYSGGLPNNVMFGENTHSNSFGFDCYNNSLCNNCYSNSWGYYCHSNSLSSSCHNNCFGDNYQYNSLGNNCYSNSWGYHCNKNSLHDWCYQNSWGDDCNNNSWTSYCSNNVVFNGVEYTQIITQYVKNVQVLTGVKGGVNTRQTLPFAASKTYTQVAAMTSAGTLKIYVPGDLA